MSPGNSGGALGVPSEASTHKCFAGHSAVFSTTYAATGEAKTFLVERLDAASERTNRRKCAILRMSTLAVQALPDAESPSTTSRSRAAATPSGPCVPAASAAAGAPVTRAATTGRPSRSHVAGSPRSSEARCSSKWRASEADGRRARLCGAGYGCGCGRGCRAVGTAVLRVSASVGFHRSQQWPPSLPAMPTASASLVSCCASCRVWCCVVSRGRDQSRSCLLADSSSAVASTTALPSQALVDTSRLRPRRHQPRWRLGRSGVTSETGAVAPICQEIDRAAYPRELPTVWGG